MRNSRVFSEGLELLQGALYLDQSTSVTDLGSLFEWQEDRPLQRLKQQLAEAYGVRWSFPSTNGTTCLNILALLSACPLGGRVLVNRDCHTSVTAAMIHSGAQPTYLIPEYDAELGISVGPTMAGFEEALSNQTVDCVFLTSPNYFGVAGELAEIISLAHQRGLPVIVDAAHAPHFHFCEALPDGAEDLGAELVCQSTHKVGSALSQASLLLIQREELIPPIYEHVNDLGFVSTSFSYPILASLELGVCQLVEEGEALWTRTIERAETFRYAINRIPGITCFGAEQAWKRGFKDFDPTRVTLDVTQTGLTGFQFKHRLIEEWIYPEMATLKHVLFLFTPGTTDDDLHKLLGVVRQIAERNGRGHLAKPLPAPPPLPKMAMIPRVAKFARKQTVPVAEAVGRIAGETVSTYPPGVPVITAGEVVSAEVIDYLCYMKDSGAVLNGSSDRQFLSMRVLSG